MKFIRKLLAVVLAAGLSFGLTAGTVFAAPSASANTPTVVNTNTKRDVYVINTSRRSSSYSSIRRNARTASVINVIDRTNNKADQTKSSGQTSKSVVQTLTDSLNNLANSSDKNTASSVKSSAAAAARQIGNNTEALTGFFDIDKTGDNVQKTSDGKYEVTLKVPTATTSTTGIKVLLFNEDTSEWEVITPTSTDLANQEITLELSELGQVMVLADEGTGTGTSTVDDNNNTNGNNGSNSGNKSNGTNGNKGSGNKSNGGSGSGSGSGSSANGSGTGSGSGSGSAKAPKTEDQSVSWMGFAAAAAVLAGASAVAFRKKEQDA